MWVPAVRAAHHDTANAKAFRRGTFSVQLDFDFAHFVALHSIVCESVGDDLSGGVRPAQGECALRQVEHAAQFGLCGGDERQPRTTRRIHDVISGLAAVFVILALAVLLDRAGAASLCWRATGELFSRDRLIPHIGHRPDAPEVRIADLARLAEARQQMPARHGSRHRAIRTAQVTHSLSNFCRNPGTRRRRALVKQPLPRGPDARFAAPHPMHKGRPRHIWRGRCQQTAPTAAVAPLMPGDRGKHLGQRHALADHTWPANWAQPRAERSTLFCLGNPVRHRFAFLGDAGCATVRTSRELSSDFKLI